MTRPLVLPAADEPVVSVVIPAFHVKTFRSCLVSLAEHLPTDLACEVVAVFNGPSGALHNAAESVDGLRVIASPHNLGFPAGLNLGRAAARGRYLLLFQDDAVAEAGWLEALVAAAEAHPEAGAVGGMVLSRDGDGVQSSGLVLWNDASQAVVDENHSVAEAGRRGLHAVDYTSSSSLLVPAAVWDSVGGACEDFFPAGHVDADLAMRIRGAGRAVLCEPAARTRHVQGASRTAGYKRFTGVRNALLFRERWGAELARTQEPPGERGRAEVERALERAGERWRRVRETGPPDVSPSAPAKPPFAQDAPREEQLEVALRHAERHLALRLAYEAELEPAFEHFEAEAVALRAESQSLRDELARSQELVESIVSGRWWRLRGRLRR